MRPLVSSFGVLLILALAGCGGGGGGGGGTDSPSPIDPIVVDQRPAVGTYDANQVGKRYDSAGGSLVTVSPTSGSVVATDASTGTTKRTKLVFTTGFQADARVLTVFIDSLGVVEASTATLTVAGNSYTVTGAAVTIGNPVDALGAPLDPDNHPSDPNDTTTYAIRVTFNHDQTSSSPGTLQERDSYLFSLPTGLFTTDSTVTVVDNQSGVNNATLINSGSGVSTKSYVTRAGLLYSVTGSNLPAANGLSYRVVRSPANPAPYSITSVNHNLAPLRLQTDGTITGSLNLDFDYPAVGTAPSGHTQRSVTVINGDSAHPAKWETTASGLKLTFSYFNPVYYTVSGTTSTFSLETDVITLTK